MVSTQEIFNFLNSILSESIKDQQKPAWKYLFANECEKWYNEAKQYIKKTGLIKIETRKVIFPLNLCFVTKWIVCSVDIKNKHINVLESLIYESSEEKKMRRKVAVMWLEFFWIIQGRYGK